MIFAQYKHAITFAVVILGLAVVVADPGNGDHGGTPAAPGQPAPQDAALATPTAHGAIAPAAAPADPAWYGEDGAAGPPVSAEESGQMPADGGGYDLPSAPPSAPAPAQGRAPAPRSGARSAAPPAAAPAQDYVPPPPPPQVPPSH